MGVSCDANIWTKIFYPMCENGNDVVHCITQKEKSPEES